MQTFLDDVAKKIVAAHSERDQVKVIVPSNRAINFLKEAFKRTIETPLVAPEIISVSQFIEELSSIQLLPKVDLLYALYEVYQEQTPKKELESFHQFYGWGATLLEEFNEIDAQLVNAKELFSFMSALGEIEVWGDQKQGDLSKRHFKIQEQYSLYYEKLYKKLLQMGRGYSGLRLREAVQNLSFYTQQNLSKHFFVGFNALTKAEETIIQELLAESKAEIIWDLDQTFYEDAYHSAGHYIRTYQKNWKVLNKQPKPKFTNYFSEAKEFEIISTAKNSIQSKTAIQIAKELKEENLGDSTVVVLGDETLLLPTLSVLPEELPWNITMGYPLKDTVLFGFFIHYFELQQSLSTLGFPTRQLYEFSQITTAKVLFQEGKSPMDQWIETQQQNFVSTTTLCAKGSIETLVFTPFDKVVDFIERLVKITQTLKQSYLKKRNESFQIQVCDRFLSVFESLIDRHKEHQFMKSLRDFKMIFESLAGEETFDFTGDAFDGVQIMGLLETRLLDFDNVIITNVNEGILPFGKTPFSWIPYEVRKKFGMNTFVEQDHLYAYHFFRLLQRSKKVFLLYNAAAEGLFSGERSRFLIHLEYFKHPSHHLVFKQVTLPISKLDYTQKKVIKTAAILAHLEHIGQEGFSPSSLTQYIRNPYRFYEQRMLKIKPVEEFNEQLSAIEKGTIMHEVLELLYSPYLSLIMKESDYDQMLEKLPEILAATFDSKTKSEEKRTGKNLLIYQVMEAVLQQFLGSEKKQVLEGNQIQIIGLEQEFKKAIEVKTIERTICFRGTVDRIDRYNGTLRFVDYKTGSVTASDLAFTDWEEIRTLPKKGPLFQVLLYAYVLKNDFNEEKCIAGVIPLKTFTNEFLAVSQKENTRKKHLLQLGDEVLNVFEKELFELLKEIFDPELPFWEKEQ